MTGLEQRIGEVLRAGTIISSLLFGAGMTIAIAGYGAGLSEVLLDTALIVLMATPAARVIVSVIAYVHERDWLFVVLTLIVLLALGGSVAAAYL